MPGVALSRWSMAFFATALVALVIAEALMVAGFGYPAAPLAAPRTLVLVHVVALGWLSLLMFGALFQFVPVLVAKPLYNNELPLAVLVLLVVGLVGLVSGFLQLDGLIVSDLPLPAIGGTLLLIGFALGIYDLGRTLWVGRPLPSPARFVTAGLVCAAVVVSLGVIFALTLSGVDGPWMAALTATGLPLHVIAGLGGWLTFTAMGVSYRLLAMFMLAPEEKRWSTRLVFRGGVAVLTIALAGGFVALLAEFPLTPVLAAAGLLTLPVLALYGVDVMRLYRRRRRKVLETNTRMASLAFLSLGLAALLGLVLAAFGRLQADIGALVYLVAFGWLTGLGLSKLYKIVAFVTWLECYGPVLGKAKTPRVQDLVVERRADPWFFVHYASSWAGTLCLLMGWPAGFRWTASAMLVGTLGLVFENLRTRRLANVPAALRLADGVPTPRLLMTVPSRN